MEQKNNKFNFQTIFTLIAFILVGILLFSTMFIRNKSIQDKQENSSFSAEKNEYIAKDAYYGSEVAGIEIFDKSGNRLDISSLKEETELYDAEGSPMNLPTISPSEYSLIKEGMSYEDVQKIVGGEGKVVKEIDSPGDEFYTVCYFFYGDKAETSASFIFQSGRLKSKANTGLEEK